MLIGEFYLFLLQIFNVEKATLFNKKFSTEEQVS